MAVPERSLTLQRLMRDFKRLRQDPPQGVNGSPNPDNIMLWNAVIFGPEDTPWDGGKTSFCGSHRLPQEATVGRMCLSHVRTNVRFRHLFVFSRMNILTTTWCCLHGGPYGSL